MKKLIENKKSMSRKLAECALNNADNIPINPRSLAFLGEQKIPKLLKQSLKR